MAAGDARIHPTRNVAYRATFPILDADGDLVTGATALDSEISKDGGTFADATSEATEIATSSGIYYLDLTATEMDADTVAVVVKTTTSGAKTTTLVMYPVTLSQAQLGVNAVQAGAVAWGSGAITAASIAANALAIAKFAADIGTTAYASNPIARAIWERLLSGTTYATGSLGAKIKTASFLDAPAVRSALGFDAPNFDTLVYAIKAVTDAQTAITPAALVDLIWDEDVDASHQTAGTAGKKLDDAGGAADPWATALPGAYGAGTAGKLVGDNVDAAVSSRAASSALATAQLDLDTLTGTDGATLATAQALYAPSKAGDAMALTAGERTTLAASIWNALTSGFATAGSIGKKMADWTIHSAADVWAVGTRLLTAGTNIALAKGTGVTGFNDLSAAQVNAEADTAITDAALATAAEIDLIKTANAAVKAVTDLLPNAGALANLDAAITTRATPAQVATELATYDAPTNAEMVARTLASASYATSAACTEARLAELDAANIPADLDAVKAKTDRIPENPAKNAAFTYTVKLVDETDGYTAETGLTVTFTRSIDGGAFASATGTVTEISGGSYKVVASAADMNGGVVTHRFAATGARTEETVIKTTA